MHATSTTCQHSEQRVTPNGFYFFSRPLRYPLRQLLTESLIANIVEKSNLRYNDLSATYKIFSSAFVHDYVSHPYVIAFDTVALERRGGGGGARFQDRKFSGHL